MTDTQAGDGIYVGCSGWAYTSWKPEFYPAKLAARKFLGFYASELNSVEVNYTFRQLPKRETVDSWLSAAAGNTNFRFSFKAPEGITHSKRLKDCGAELKRLCAALEPVANAKRLGLILFQLPPNFKADIERLDAFLKDAVAEGELRFAFEFRHPSWFEDRCYAILKQHHVALCVAETDDLKTPDVTTANFACFRFRRSSYTPSDLRHISNMLLARGRSEDVFGYFKHEDAPHGPLRAREVLKHVREA